MSYPQRLTDYGGINCDTFFVPSNCHLALDSSLLLLLLTLRTYLPFYCDKPAACTVDRRSILEPKTREYHP